MSVDQLAVWVKIAAVMIIGFSAVCGVIRFIILAYRGHKTRNAPVFTDRATVYFMHPEKDAPYLGRGYSYVYYITFHTDSGLAQKLYMTKDEFYIIQEGDTGMLTWQGNKLWKFIPDKKKEESVNV